MLDYINDLTFSRYLLYKTGLLFNPNGSVVNVVISTRATRFELTFHMQLRRKLRKKYHVSKKSYFITKETVNWATEREKFKVVDFQQYHISGVCIAYNRAGILTSCIIRNVLSSFPFEYRIPVYCSGVNAIDVLRRHIVTRHRRAKRWHLRLLPPAKSKTSFRYVLSKLTPVDYLNYRQDLWT